MNIPVELLEELHKGNVVLFCGAGISISDGGIPSSSQLARELAQRANLGDVGSMSLPEVAQAYELVMGTQSLIAYVTERVDDPRYSLLRAHRLIAALPFKRIITTNWDNLLEEALRQARKPFVKVVRDSEVPFTDDEKVLLIKLHGSAEQKDTIVITGDDYYNVFARLPQVANLVQSFFATKTLLFLGYGLADEDFKRLYMEVVRHLGKHKRRAYAVQLNPTPLTVKYWEQKNVQVIAADATAFLESLAAELGAHNFPPSSGVANMQSPPRASSLSPMPTTASTSRGRSAGAGHFSVERGLQVMKDALRGADQDTLLEFSTLESRLLENIRSERLYGSTETVRNERAQIVQELNRLAIGHLGTSFNDLCTGMEPKPGEQQAQEPNEIIERLRRIEQKLDQGRAEDRQAAAQILDAIKAHEVSDAEVAQIVSELRAWTKAVEQTGLPLQPELQDALKALTEHSGSAYQYLQLALPIIPGILTYNVELGSQHQADLKALWERIKARLGK